MDFATTVGFSAFLQSTRGIFHHTQCHRCAKQANRTPACMAQENGTPNPDKCAIDGIKKASLRLDATARKALCLPCVGSLSIISEFTTLKALVLHLFAFLQWRVRNGVMLAFRQLHHISHLSGLMVTQNVPPRPRPPLQHPQVWGARICLSPPCKNSSHFQFQASRTRQLANTQSQTPD